jgi:hypothetical protein
MAKLKEFSPAEAKQTGDALGIDWAAFDVEQFRLGLQVELEHGTRDPQTNVTGDDALITGKIALAHLNEFPDYYTRLLQMEKEADDYWAHVNRPPVPRSRLQAVPVESESNHQQLETGK